MTASMASAQQVRTMQVHRANGEVSSFDVASVDSVTFASEPWTSLGYCLYSEDFIASTMVYGGNEDYYLCEYYVEVQESDEQPGLYRLVDPYGPGIYPWAERTTYDTEQDHYYIEINACTPTGVYVDYQYTGMSWNGGFGPFYLYSMAAYFMDHGSTLGQEIIDGTTGKLVDGVITFPEDMLFTHLPEYNTNYYTANYHGKFKLDLNDKSDGPGQKGVRARKTI